MNAHARKTKSGYKALIEHNRNGRINVEGIKAVRTLGNVYQNNLRCIYAVFETREEALAYAQKQIDKIQAKAEKNDRITEFCEKRKLEGNPVSRSQTSMLLYGVGVWE